MAAFSESAVGTRRTFLTPPMRRCHREIRRWMEELQLRVRIDAAGNLRGLYPGAQENAPILLIGSHLDTVPNAGAYDGVLGVALAIALLEELRGRRLPFAVEVVEFSEEEGVRFGAPFIGSRALVGRLDQELLQVRDADGITVEGAIKAFGLNPEDIRNAALEPDALGYLEFHIEQGPVLESCDRPLAAVEAIVGQSRLELVLTGRANHSGTAPMHLRFDALAGAAEWIGEVEQFAKSTPGIAATVGTIEVSPGATNVIAGEARLTLDLRHCSDHVRTRSVEELIRRADQIAARRGLSVQKRSLLNQPAVAMDPFLTGEIEKAIGKIGCTPHRMASGAGHDAMIMAERVPSGMVFLRSPGGISHDPAESVLAADVEKAIACGFQLLDQLAASPAFHQTRFTKG